MPQRRIVGSTRRLKALYEPSMDANVYLLMAAALAYSGYMLIAMRP